MFVLLVVTALEDPNSLYLVRLATTILMLASNTSLTVSPVQQVNIVQVLLL